MRTWDTLGTAVVAGLVLAGGILAPAAPARGQDRSGRVVYEQELRSRLDQQLPEAQDAGFDAGGWFTFALFNYDDIRAERHRMLRQYELRGWGSYSYKGVHEAYFRGLLRWSDWNSGDNPRYGRGDDFDEKVERAWYRFDLGKMIRNQTGQAPSLGLRAQVGRQYATIGTALTLSMPLDMVKVEAEVGPWEMMAFLGKALRKSRNIDESFLVDNRQDRCLWGAQVRSRHWDRHRPFAYFFQNCDRTAGHPRSTSQSFEYDSFYVGAGSEGTLAVPQLRYRFEVAGEWGLSYADGRLHGREDVCAMALDAQLEYAFDCATHPKVSVEYLFGSGDGDRGTSSVATAGGNMPGTRDTAFNGFGYRDTGLALAPRISNLHIYSLGASFLPLETSEWFRKLEVGTKVFFYHKDDASGAISEPAAANDSSWVGWEWDVYFDWRITEDLAWTTRYGAFQPGDAFRGGDRTCQQFLYTALVLSF